MYYATEPLTVDDSTVEASDALDPPDVVSPAVPTRFDFFFVSLRSRHATNPTAPPIVQAKTS